MRRAARILTALVCLSLFGAIQTRAETVVNYTVAEQQMIDQNPALLELATTAPETLRLVLDGIAAALENPSGTRGGLEDLDAADVKVLGQNPALLQVWRSSPEASADLLSLIRVAAGGGKPQK